MTLAAGKGGDSDSGTGGGGGNLNKMTVTVDPANLVTGVDDTTLLNMHAGAGGAGVNGGKGGAITGLTATAIYNDVSGGSVSPSAFAADIEAGAGGVGLAGRGGAGGAVTLDGKASLTGVSFYDLDSPIARTPGLIVLGGAGGVGSTSGGAGGSVINVGTQNTAVSGGINEATNQLTSAVLAAGTGGAGLGGSGGAGGDVLTADVAVQALALHLLMEPPTISAAPCRSLAAPAARDRRGRRRGRSRKGVHPSLSAGRPGSGRIRRAGGGRQRRRWDHRRRRWRRDPKLTLNSPSDPYRFRGAFCRRQRWRGAESGHAGTGGAVKGVTQTKDVNSSISVISRGAGGAGGGVGGSVKNINTVGFIGSPNSAGKRALGCSIRQ